MELTNAKTLGPISALVLGRNNGSVVSHIQQCSSEQILRKVKNAIRHLSAKNRYEWFLREYPGVMSRKLV